VLSNKEADGALLLSPLDMDFRSLFLGCFFWKPHQTKTSL